MTWQLISPRASNPREKSQKPHVFYDLDLEVICQNFCHIFLVQKTYSDSVWEAGTIEGSRLTGSHLGDWLSIPTYLGYVFMEVS